MQAIVLADIPARDLALAAFGIMVILLLLLVILVIRMAGAAGVHAEHLRVLAEQALAGQRAEAEMTRASLSAATQRAATDAADRLAGMAERVTELRGQMGVGIETVRTTLSREQGELRLQMTDLINTQFGGNRSLLETKLGEIQKSVNEQLHAAVEKQMNESFARVIDQFTAVQKAMGDVQAVTAQIGDIKRLFSNVKTRGGWGETQVRAMLEDVLPPGTWEANRKLRADSDELVDFAVAMPMRGAEHPWLPVDSKFPVEDYERLILAAEAGDVEGERAARRGLERRVRDEARKIRAKYINPPVTVEFAVMYLPTDGLYAEIARAPGLIDEIGRETRVLILGPSLFPALLRTIHLGHVTLTLESRAEEVMRLLGATKQEMMNMDDVLSRLAKQAGSFSNTIERARTRTRAVRRKLRGVEQVDRLEADQVLQLDSSHLADEAADLDAEAAG